MSEDVTSVKYRTIVADPPWPYPEGFATQNRTPGKWAAPVRSKELPYQAMSLAQIEALPVRTLAQGDVAGNRPDKSVPRDGSLLYLWATTRYLEAAHGVARAWGFRPSIVIVWCKSSPSTLAGTWAPTVEFVIVARRGSPSPAKTSYATRWFQWPRGRHSEKPDAFYDMVEAVSPGPYCELFARRDRLGWDTWGNESLGTAGFSVDAGNAKSEAGGTT